MQKIDKKFFKKYYPKLKDNSYKNINGKVLVIAGSQNMQGAAVLNVLAAYLSGAGMVALASSKEVISAAVCRVPEVLVCPLGKKPLSQIKGYIKDFKPDVIFIGSGLGSLAKYTLKILSFSKTPSVIDADSLTFLAKQGVEKLPKTGAYILTPHIGEMKRLLSANKIDSDVVAQILAEKTSATVLLKGPKTKVSTSTRTLQNTTGNSGLAKAGSGDVLGGIISTIFAKLLKHYDVKRAAFLAASLGVFLHGAAADRAAKKYGKLSLLATDTADALPQTLKFLLK